MIFLPKEIINYIFGFLNYKLAHKKKYLNVINDIKDIGHAIKNKTIYNKKNGTFTLPSSIKNKFLKIAIS